MTAALPVRLLRLGRSNAALLVEALATLGWASLAIRLFSFRRVVARASAGPDRPEPDAETRRREIARCRWAVRRWAGLAPWRAVCFQQGLALHVMLRRRGIRSVLHYGVSQRYEDRLSAHVWISADGAVVLGGEVVDQFSCLASFPPGPGAPR